MDGEPVPKSGTPLNRPLLRGARGGVPSLRDLRGSSNNRMAAVVPLPIAPAHGSVLRKGHLHGTICTYISYCFSRSRKTSLTVL